MKHGDFRRPSVVDEISLQLRFDREIRSQVIQLHLVRKIAADLAHHLPVVGAGFRFAKITIGNKIRLTIRVSLLTIEVRKVVVRHLVVRVRHRRKRQQFRLSVRHDRAELPVHHRQSDVFQLRRSEEGNLRNFVHQVDVVQPELPVDGIAAAIGGIDDRRGPYVGKRFVFKVL